MTLISQTIGLFAAAFTAEKYYKALNNSLKRFNDEYTMLHYPLYKKHDDSFLQSQKNLTDHCLGMLKELKGKSVLEIGCGNGVQSCYITELHKPSKMTGIDLNPYSIEIANNEKLRRNLTNVHFHVDDAQQMHSISDESQDIIINIESAFHYPDKSAFLREIHRVLKPGGHFLIADLVTLKKKGFGLREKWKRLQALHHWNEEKYTIELQNTGLSILRNDDITEEVVKGFKSYPLWFRQMRRKGFINDSVFKLFYLVILYWYIFLLTKRRRYLVFSGMKAA